MANRWLLACLASTCSGCFGAKYLLQAAGGQYQLLHLARPISRVVEDQRAPERVRRMLAHVPAIKRFARSRGLKPTKSYADYSDLGRAAAVWIVQGCEPLAFDVRRWHFPLVGSVPYLGFFEEAAAHRYAEELQRAEALDVTVRTASAYSTLGWFRDPVLSTMIPDGEEAVGELANVILHESVHATVYLPSQSAFNESIASFVADGLTFELLLQRFGAGSPELRAWRETDRRRAASAERMHAAYERLESVYGSARGAEEKQAEKTRILEEVRQELRLRQPINNATVAGHRTYGTGKEALERLRATCAGDWPTVVATLRTVKGDDFARPQQADFDAVIDRLVSQVRGQ